VFQSANLKAMVKKSISAMLLFVVAAWAEFGLAPLLALHTHAQMVAMEAEHHPAPSPAHPCCPKTHASPPAVMPPYEISSAGLPCADEHRCCFRQGPQSAPAPVKDADRLSRDLMAANQASTAADSQSQGFADVSIPSGLGSPPPDLDMVLRI
jgi:hypothetical protein